MLSELGNSHCALVALALNANRYLTLGLLLLAYDKQEWDALKLVIANLTANLLVTVGGLFRIGNMCTLVADSC